MWQPLPTADQVAAFLGWPADTASQVAPHLASATIFVRSYTRGVGFDLDTEGNPVCADDLAAVIVQACCRSATNPAQVTREEVGSWNSMPARFDGYTIAEQFVLNGYRRRTA